MQNRVLTVKLRRFLTVAHMQAALMLELARLPGAEQARAVAGQLNLLIEEADTAGVQAVLLLQAQVQQLGRAGGLT